MPRLLGHLSSGLFPLRLTAPTRAQARLNLDFEPEIKLRGGVQLQLMGADVTSPHSTLTSLHQATPPKHAGMLAQLSTLEKLLAGLDAKQLHDNPYLPTYRKPTQLGQVHALLQELRTNSLRYRTLPRAQLAWRDQLLHLLEQYSTRLTLAFDVEPDYQAACQAKNVRWLDQQLPSHKLALWGHSNLVSKETGWPPLRQPNILRAATRFIGAHLWRIWTGMAGPPLLSLFYLATYEAYFHATQLPLALFELRHLALNASTNGWLFQRLLLRDVALKTRLIILIGTTCAARSTPFCSVIPLPPRYPCRNSTPCCHLPAGDGDLSRRPVRLAFDH